MSSTEDEEEMPRETGIQQPTFHDVLLGRGAACWNHVGNRKFRHIVAMYLCRYENCKARIEKMIVVAEIVRQIINSGGRFLKKDPRTMTWFTVERKAAVEKVGHAIRDKRAMENKREYNEKVIKDLHLETLRHSTKAAVSLYDLGRIERVAAVSSMAGPGLSSVVLDNGRHHSFAMGSDTGELLRSQLATGWREYLERPGGGRSMETFGMPSTRVRTRSDIEDETRQLQHRLLMDQSSQQMITSAALRSIRKTEEALLSIQKRAEMTQTALWTLRVGNRDADFDETGGGPENSRRTSTSLILDMRRASSVTAALSSDIGDHMFPSSLPSFPQEKQPPGSERALYMPPRREVSLHEVLMERPRTNTSETQAALRTLQRVLGDEETAKAIRRASSVMTAGASFKQKDDSRLSLLPGRAYIQQAAWEAESLSVERAGLLAKSGVARPGDGAAPFMLGSSDITTGGRVGGKESIKTMKFHCTLGNKCSTGY
jgi:hypothetical protein